MKVLKIIGIVLAVVILLFVGIAFVLPQTVTVERDILVNASPDKVFPHVNSFDKFNAWSPWFKRDPNTVYKYEGPKEGVGAKMSWTSDHPEVGNGAQEITESKPNELVKTNLDFGDQGTAVAFYKLEAQGEQTKVTWGFESDMGMNPIGRWMGLMMERWLAPDYEEGLANLKKIVES